MKSAETPGATSPVLAVEALTKRFGGLRAVDSLDFQIQPAEIFALIGPNGSGKTTCINAISGELQASSGRVLLGDLDITVWPAHRRAAHGVARTFQNLQLFDELTVRENVMVGRYSHGQAGLLAAFFKTPASVREHRASMDEADRLLEFVDLADHADALAGGLSYGLKRRLEIARALATKPDVLLLDEPAAGLNPPEVEALANLIRRIRSDDTAILLIEHKMDFIMGIADRVCVLNDGRRIALDVPKAVVSDPSVIEAYLGSSGGEVHA